MHDPHCLRLRLLAACRQSYDSIIAGHDPYGIGWADLGPLVENPKKIPKEPDVALVGRIPEGVLIVFRGTRPPGKDDKDPVSTVRDWLNDAACVPLRSIYPGDVHAGFERSVSRLWSDVRAHVERLLADGAKRQLFVTGHSKGGAMAFLAAWRLARELPGDLVIRVITFAAARPGGGDFARAFEADHRIRSTRYEVRLDLVPGLPPGPIASPGKASLEAALTPANAPYLYFVSRNDGSHVFAQTLDEHNANVRKFQIDFFRQQRQAKAASAPPISTSRAGARSTRGRVP